MPTLIAVVGDDRSDCALGWFCPPDIVTTMTRRVAIVPRDGCRRAMPGASPLVDTSQGVNDNWPTEFSHAGAKISRSGGAADAGFRTPDVGMAYTLLTGGTGFLGRYILKDCLLAEVPMAVLIRPNKRETAQQRLEAVLGYWEQRLTRSLPRPVIIEGDVRQSRGGIDDRGVRWIAEHCHSIAHRCGRSKPFREYVVGPLIQESTRAIDRGGPKGTGEESDFAAVGTHMRHAGSRFHLGFNPDCKAGRLRRVQRLRECRFDCQTLQRSMRILLPCALAKIVGISPMKKGRIQTRWPI